MDSQSKANCDDVSLHDSRAKPFLQNSEVGKPPPPPRILSHLFLVSRGGMYSAASTDPLGKTFLALIEPKRKLQFTEGFPVV